MGLNKGLPWYGYLYIGFCIFIAFFCSIIGCCRRYAYIQRAENRQVIPGPMMMQPGGMMMGGQPMTSSMMAMQQQQYPQGQMQPVQNQGQPLQSPQPQSQQQQPQVQPETGAKYARMNYPRQAGLMTERDNK